MNYFKIASLQKDDVRKITGMIPAYAWLVDDKVKGVDSLLKTNQEDFEEHFEITLGEFQTLISSGKIDQVVLDANIKEFCTDISLDKQMMALKNMKVIEDII